MTLNLPQSCLEANGQSVILGAGRVQSLAIGLLFGNVGEFEVIILHMKVTLANDTQFASKLSGGQ